MTPEFLGLTEIIKFSSVLKDINFNSTSKADFNEVVNLTVTEFQEKHPKIQIQNDLAFRNKLEKILKKLTPQQGKLSNLDTIFNKDEYHLMFHENRETAIQHSLEFFRLFIKTLCHSNRFHNHTSYMYYQQILQNQTEFKQDIKSIQQTLGEITPFKQHLIGSEISPGPAYNKALAEEIKTNDRPIASKINEFKKSVEKRDYELIRKIATELFLAVKIQQPTVYAKIAERALSIHLYGDEDTWEEGARFYESIESKHPYLHVLAAMLYNNTKKWRIAKETIERANPAEKEALSDAESNEYYKTFSLIQFNLKSIKSSRELISKAKGNDDGFKKISMTVFSNSLEKNYLDFAKYFLEEKTSNLNLFAEAVSYCLNRLILLQEKYHNQIKAYEDIQGYLDLVYKKSKTILLNLPHISSDTEITILSAIPIIARANGNLEEAVDFIDLGIRNKIQDGNFINNSATLLLGKQDYERIIQLLINSKLEDIKGSFFHLICALKATDNNEKIEKLKDEVEKSMLSIEDRNKLLSELFCHTLSSDDFLIIAKKNYKLHRSSPWAKWHYAEALVRVKNIDEAEKVFLDIYKSSNRNLQSTVSLAKFYAKEKTNNKKALGFFKEFISKNSRPEEANLYFECLLNSKQYEEVIRKAELFDPNHSNKITQLYRGISLGYTQKYKFAVTLLKPIVHTPSNPDLTEFVFYTYSFFAGEIQNFNEELWGLEKCIHLDSKNSNYRYLYSRALARQGKYEQALKAAIAMLQNSPNEEEEYIQFLYALNLLNDKDPNNQYLNSTTTHEFFTKTLREFSTKYPDNGYCTQLSI